MFFYQPPCRLFFLISNNELISGNKCVRFTCVRGDHFYLQTRLFRLLVEKNINFTLPLDITESQNGWSWEASLEII